jgi:hypothetical protein
LSSLSDAPLPKLLCGTPAGDSISDEALLQLAASILKFSNRSFTYAAQEDPDNLLTFGPFCARVILENGCAALTGRLDSFRLLYLSEFQKQPQYEKGKRVKSAFSWSSDVMVEEKADSALWSADREMEKISRALLSKHSDHLYWKPALNDLLDNIAGRTDGELEDIRSIVPEEFITRTRGQLSQYYSQLSKGVHWEFFNSAQQLDDVTIRSLMRDTILQLAALGLASHFIPTSYASLPPEAAIEAYIELRRMVA